MLRRSVKNKSRFKKNQLENLEPRVLLAGDLVAHWQAESLNSLDDGALVASWTDSVGGTVAASFDGQPTLAKGAIGGRSAVRFTASDGIDSLKVGQAESPMSDRGDFSMAVVFSTSSSSLQGGNGDWFDNTGIVDANTLGFGKDWGLTINAAGEVSVGMATGFLQPKETIYSDTSSNDGEPHFAIWTRSGSNMQLYVDARLVAETNAANADTRSRLDMFFGKNASNPLGLDGDIAEIRIYDGQLTEAEVQNVHGSLTSYYNNGRPVANADEYTFPEDAGILETIVTSSNGVLKNDTDPDGDALTAVVVETTSHGELGLAADGGFIYTPEPNFFGTDSFTYTANDFRASEPTTVSITVTPKYDPAVAFPDNYKGLAAEVLTVDAASGLFANDINLDEVPLTAKLVSDVPAGQLTLNDDGSFQYDPQGFFGKTTFSYQIDDGMGLSNTASVSLTINTPPTAVSDSYDVNEDTILSVGTTIAVTANDIDPENDALTATLVSDVSNGVLAFQSNGTFIYTPAADYFGADSFSYMLTDGEDPSNTVTVSLNVNAVNDAPTTVADTYFGLSDAELIIDPGQGVLANDFDVEGDAFTATISSQPENGSVTLTPDGGFSFNPTAGFTGVTSFTYTASDGQDTSAETTVDIAINSLEQQQSIVINELHIDPDVKTEHVEFIELHNTGDVPIDLSGWTIRNALDFTFPNGASIDAGGYAIAAQNPEMLNTKFGKESYGPWSGRLRNEGDVVEIWTPAGTRIDEVDYQLGFPWPTVGDAPGPSAQLVSPALANDVGGNWRSALPTPGAQNTVFTDNNAPAIRQVDHSPKSPTSADPVTITAKVTDDDGVQSVTLSYQLVNPGDYISISDERYETSWTEIAMRDDGQEGDETADDGIYTVVLGADLQEHRRLIRYRIAGADSKGASDRAPYADDTQPNFAYFVYDGVPDWTGADQPGVTDPVTYNSDLLTSIPVYHLITTSESHKDSQHIPGSSRRSGYTGSDYQWEGSMVYDGEVYDHIRYRARGGVWRYAMGKNMWKFDFNRGHSFEARDNYGDKYDVPWDKLNFSALIQQGNFRHRGEQGLFESVGFNLYNLAGTEAPNTNYVHFRIVGSENENGPDQYSGDFQGLYMAIEHPDGNFLDQHDMPDGNFYKIESNRAESTVNQGPNQVDDASDAREFIREFTGRNNPEVEWWHENVDLEKFYGYQAISHGIHHYDTAFGKNFYYYNNPESGKWEIHPWDLDLTWADNMFGNENHEWNVKAAKNADFNDYQLQANIDLNNRLNRDYQNRTREILDLLFNQEQTGILIDEMSSFVYQPGMQSLVDADRAMWDYNPNAMNSRFSNRDKNLERWKFYEEADTNDYPGMVQILKDYVDTRTDWINRRILTNEENIPNTPTISYTGPNGFPINELSFQTSAFSSPINAEFAAMEWRIAEITDPNDPNFNRHSTTERRIYEINANWESGELSEFSESIVMPGENLEVGKTYRARVRMLDNDGHWSHWSEPAQFVSGAAVANGVADVLRVTEVHYNPAAPTSAELAAGFEDSDDFEFIEFTNIGSETIDLIGVTLDEVDIEGNDEGVNFSFGQDGTITSLAAGATVLVVEDAAAFAFRYGNDLPVAGEWAGKLSNAGETLTVSVFETVAQQFAFDDQWYAATDGEGASLELINPNNADLSSWSTKEAWRASSSIGGSPGGEGNPGPVPGDSNGDGVFDSGDLVAVFSAGEYEDDIAGNSTFEEGDWNGDGDFDSTDLVFVFTAGNYVSGASPLQFNAASIGAAFANNHDSDAKQVEPLEQPTAEMTEPARQVMEPAHLAADLVFDEFEAGEFDTSKSELELELQKRFDV